MKEERRIPLLSRLAGKASGRGLSRSEYLSAVAEDVEELLNTRAPCGNGVRPRWTGERWPVPFRLRWSVSSRA